MPHRDVPAGDVDVVIRPEAVQINDGEPRANEMAGTISTATYMGSHAEYHVATPIGRIFAISPDPRNVKAVGANVGVSFAERGVFIVKP
jgi:iron(III) transport system ATP-binding protein